MAHAATDDGIDIHVKVGVFGEQLQFPVENFQTLLRNFVGIHVINRNRAPYNQDPRRSASGCDPAVSRYPLVINPDTIFLPRFRMWVNDVIQFRMQQRFATAVS